jgi:hypothetical protein
MSIELSNEDRSLTVLTKVADYDELLTKASDTF